MDFAHQENFSAKKAGGIGLTVALHVLVACGLIYGLHRTFIPVDPPLVAKLLPPPEHVIKETPPDQPFKQASNPPPTIHTLELPKIDIDNKTAITPSKTIDDGELKKGPFTEGPVIASIGGGNGHAALGITKSAISNLDACKPEYPRSSLLKEEEGTVRVQFEIGADSRLISANVLKTSGYRALDNAAVKALSRCEFKAAIQNGTPVSSSLVTDYVWSLQNE